MHKCVRAHSTHVAYIRRSSAVCTLILRVDSGIAAADRSAEETRVSCQCWDLEYTIQTWMHYVRYLKHVIVTGYS